MGGAASVARAKVTDRAFLDICIGKRKAGESTVRLFEHKTEYQSCAFACAGRIIVDLFGAIAPTTVSIFKALCAGMYKPGLYEQVLCFGHVVAWPSCLCIRCSCLRYVLIRVCGLLIVRLTIQRAREEAVLEGN